MKVGFLGPKATFTELAVKRVFPDTRLSHIIQYLTVWMLSWIIRWN